MPLAPESLQREVVRNLVPDYDVDGTSIGQSEPPNYRYAEQAILGAILIDNSQFEKIAGQLSADDFYQPKHKAIYSAYIKLFEGSENVDLVTTRTTLEKSDELQTAGGIEYLLELANETPYAGNTEYYAKIVRECAVLRLLLKCTREIQNMVYSARELPAQEVLSKSQHLIYQIDKDVRSNVGLKHVKDFAGEALDKVEELYRNPVADGITGVASGFIDLDRVTLGFQPSDLIIIAGRPSMGKTALALNIAEYAAVNSKLRVAIFSLEMSGVSLAYRLLSSLSGIDSKRIREGNFGEGKQAELNWKRYAHAFNELNKAEICIDETSGISPIEISARSRRMKREPATKEHKGGLDLVIVDYLQLLQMQSKEVNRVTEIANITRELKFLAKELDIPVIALSQLSRAAENRTRPKMADLRDSGAIEQDADVVIFIYRDEVYDPNSRDAGKAEIIISKHRNGETGTIQLAFHKGLTRFDNLDRRDYDDSV